MDMAVAAGYTGDTDVETVVEALKLLAGVIGGSVDIDEIIQRVTSEVADEVDDIAIAAAQELIDNHGGWTPPLMSSDTLGGAKLGDGLVLDGEALGVGELVKKTDGDISGSLYEINADGWSRYRNQDNKNLLVGATDFSDTQDGVAYDIDGHRVVVSGSKTKTSVHVPIVRLEDEIILRSGATYTFSLQGTFSWSSSQLYVMNGDAVIRSLGYGTDGVWTFTVNELPEFTMVVNGFDLQNSVTNNVEIDAYAQLEYGGAATAYEPCAGSDGSAPSPDSPRAIECACGRNLFNGSVADGTYDDSTGEESESDVSVRIGKTSVVPSASYNISFIRSWGISTLKLYEWEADGTYVGETDFTLNSANVRTSVPFRTGPDTASVAFSCIGTSDRPERKESISDVQLERGGVKTPYVPYGHVGLHVMSRNLLSVYGQQYGTKNGLAFIFREDGSIRVRGTATGYTYYQISNNRILRNGTTYTLSGCPKGGGVSTYYLNTSGAQDYGNGATFTANSETSRTFSIIVNTTDPIDIIFRPQLVEGDSVQAFSQYFDVTVPVPLPEYGVASSLPGGSCDSLHIDSSGHVQWSQRVGVADDIGSLNPTWAGLGEVRTDVIPNGKGSSTYYDCMCTHYPKDSHTGWNSSMDDKTCRIEGYQPTGYWDGVYHYSSRICIKDSSFTETDDFAELLDDVTILYECNEVVHDMGYVELPGIHGAGYVEIPELLNFACKSWVNGNSSLIEFVNEYNKRMLNGLIDQETGGLDATKLSGTVPSDCLPSYVDDVVEAYYHGGAFYEDSAHTTQVTGETGKIYVDLHLNGSYRFTGSTFVKIANPSEIATKAEAETGTDDTKTMTPLKTKQAIVKLIPTMDAATKGGAKLGRGLAVESDVLSVGSLTEDTDGAIYGPLEEVTAKGWSTQIGPVTRNLCPCEVVPGTYNGITVTVNSDGSVKVNGTASELTVIPVATGIPVTAGNYYTLSGCPENGSLSTYRLAMSQPSGDTYTTTVYDTGSGKTVIQSADALVDISIHISSGTSINATYYPQFEVGQSATQYIPHNALPTPSTPVPVVSAKGRNLLDESAWINDGLIPSATDGQLVSSSASHRSPLIPVTTGNYVYAVTNKYANGGKYVHAYDSNGTWLALLVSKSSATVGERIVAKFAVTSNIAYVCVVNQTIDVECQLESGSTATPYVPYGSVGLDAKSKNLLPISLSIIKASNTEGTWSGNQYSYRGLLFTVNDDLSIRVTGTKDSNYSSVAMRLTQGGNFAVSAGTYTMSGSIGGSNQTYRLQFKKNDVWQTQLSDAFTFTAAQNDAFTSFGVAIISNSSVDVTFYPQLEAGSTATPYAPNYYDSTTPVPLPPAGFAAALPDGTADELQINAAGHVTWTQWVGVKDLGELTWTMLSGKNVFQSSDVAGMRTGTYRLLDSMCSSYVAIASPASSDEMQSGNDKTSCVQSGQKKIFVKDTTYLDATTFKQSSSGVMFYYPLATPVTHDLGYIDLPSVYGEGTANIPELAAFGCRSWVDEDGTIHALADAYHTRTLSEVAQATSDALASVAPVEGATASTNYAQGSYLVHDGKLCKVTSAIASGETIAIGTNVAATTVAAEILALQD